MKSQLRLVKMKYIVSGSTVVANCEFEARDMQAHLGWLMMDEDNLNGYITVKGIAKCNPTDIFDEKVGRQVAYGRAKIKALNILNEYINNAWNVKSKEISDLSKSYKLNKAEKDFIKKKSLDITFESGAGNK